MPVTEHMKILLHEAEVKHKYRRRQSHLDDPHATKPPPNYRPDPKQKRPAKWFDETREQFDSYSNIDVGTTFHHLPFLMTKNGRLAHGPEPQNFYHVFDLDESHYRRVIFNSFLKEILKSTIFRSTIITLVLINAVLIGFNTSDTANAHYLRLMEVIDQFLFTVFTFEILLKWCYDFRGFWIVWWNILDFFVLVVIAYATLLPAFLPSRSLIAIIRVGRALRSIRALSPLSSLKVVTKTMFKSVVDLFNILFVLIIFMVVMAVAGVVLFDDEKLQTGRFLSALDSWFVLFICVTQDGWIEVLDQFRRGDKMNIDETTFVFIALYLCFGVTVCAFVFANLIIAVIVANLESSIKVLKSTRGTDVNPLIYEARNPLMNMWSPWDELSSNLIDVVPIYRTFHNNHNRIHAQRPFMAPKLNYVTTKYFKNYLHIIVALEQNMLEYSALENDLLRLLGVILSISKQLDPQTEEDVSPEQQASRKSIARLKYAEIFATPTEKEEIIDDYVQLLPASLSPKTERRGGKII